MKNLMLGVILIAPAALTCASPDIGQLRRKSDEELVAMLLKAAPLDDLAIRNGASREQMIVLKLLEQRYELPARIGTDPGIIPPEPAYPTNKVVSPTLVSNLFLFVDNRKELPRARHMGLDLMNLLLVRTNICPVFERLLENPVEGPLEGYELVIRLEAACSVVHYSVGKRRPISSVVAKALRHILASKATEGELCAALECVTLIGEGAKSCAEEVRELTEHRSKEVREAAGVALKAILPDGR